MPAPEPGERWGILGGAFDPIHLGHLALARDVKRLRPLDRILFVPTFEPPHRSVQPVASFEDRCVMTRLAIEDQADMAASRIEERTSRPSFTLDTVQALKIAHPGVEFELVIGADQLGLLSTWHCWRDLIDEVRLIVGNRPGTDITQVILLNPNRIIVLDTALMDVSSTEIRARLAAGARMDELSAMLPPGVAKYIESRNLYR